MSRSYAIIGTGALGGYYGCRLAHGGCDVHFLLHSDYDHVRQHGLICESKDGDFSIAKPNIYRDAHDMSACDVVCVCLKTTQNHLLPSLLPPTGLVLVMQNGLGVEDEIAGIVGPQRVAGCLCFLCSNKIGPGHIRHLDYGFVSLGEFASRGASDRLRAVAGDFHHAGIPAQVTDDLRVARWQKLVWNIPYNGLSVILNAGTDELMANPDTRRLVEQIMREVVADANACGAPVGDEIIAKLLAYTDQMKPYRTSMKIDFDERRPMEIESIFGNPLRAAQAAGAASPLLEALYQQLKFLNDKNRQDATPAK
jgi:2-dehydropantoate 2-reductase